MGCANSKADDPLLVSLCRERRDLIRAAADHRYALAAAHAAYFSSLERVGVALHRFAADELTLSSSSSAIASPLLTLPPSDSKSKSKSDGGVASSLSSSSSISSFCSECSHLHLPPEESEEDGHADANSHLHFPSGSESEDSFHGGFQQNPAYHPHAAPQFGYTSYPKPNANPTPNFSYMKASSAAPSTFYFDPATGQYDYPSLANDDYQNYNYYNNFYNYSDPPPRNDPPPPAPPPPPPPPPPPELSAWDFFDPFISFQQDYPEFLNSRQSFRSGSGLDSVSSPNSSEIREKEGIPDLEEETEVDLDKEVVKDKKKKKKTSNAVKVESKKAAPLQEEVGENAPENENVRKKGVSFEEESSLEMEESRSGSSLSTEESRSGNGSSLNFHPSRDVVEAMEEIKEKFKLAAGSGEEVASLLEVGKLRYRSRSRVLRVIISRILDFMAQAVLASSTNSSNLQHHSDASMPKPDGGSSVNSGHISEKSDNLSSTLEKLYVWEKRLYKEVKDEEKLRLIYEKECRRLKALDDVGAESYKIDATRAAIRKLQTKISMTIRSIDAISSRIHKLRDHELRPQLFKLIQGLITMWKSMLDCHQNQFHAIMESKTQHLTARANIHKDSVAKATMELELELLNWCSCFRNWIGTQKAYVEALNGWLIKWLLQEQEETPDGLVPFSPSRIGAPTVFVVLNDWQHAVERISEIEVVSALHVFAANVHKLWESQDEEQRQKLKAEYLSRDFSRRLMSLQKENGMHGPPNILNNKPVPNLNNETYQKDNMMALDSMRKRLDEEKARHHEIVERVREVASSSLQVGLAPVFEALGSYTFETLKAYEGLRMPNNVEGI